jgi:hypothetical protein
MTVTAALTYPVTDRAGDYVVPAGIDWAVHKADPWVGLEHYRWTRDRTDWVLPGPRDVDLEPVRVGTAARPDGRYAVELKAMREGPIPFGTTHFSNSRLGTQTFRLVEDGTLDGVSIEFTLRKGCYSELGPSPLENRPAYRVESCTGLGWVHCVTPVNPGALVLKALHSAAAERATRVVRDGRVGVEEAHPLILKALSRFAPGKSTTVTSGFARVEKAMADSPEMEPAYEPEDAAPEAAEGTPTAQAAYTLSQGLEDLCGQVKELLGKGEHVKGKAKLNRVLEDLEDAKAAALEAAKLVEADTGDKADDESEPEPEPLADDATDADDDGYLKAIPVAIRKSIRRFSLAEVRKAAPVAPPAAPEPEPAQKSTYEQLVEAYAADPRGVERLDRRSRKKLPAFLTD